MIRAHAGPTRCPQRRGPRRCPSRALPLELRAEAGCSFFWQSPRASSRDTPVRAGLVGSFGYGSLSISKGPSSTGSSTGSSSGSRPSSPGVLPATRGPAGIFESARQRRRPCRPCAWGLRPAPSAGVGGPSRWGRPPCPSPPGRPSWYRTRRRTRARTRAPRGREPEGAFACACRVVWVSRFLPAVERMVHPPCKPPPRHCLAISPRRCERWSREAPPSSRRAPPPTGASSRAPSADLLRRGARSPHRRPAPLHARDGGVARRRNSERRHPRRATRGDVRRRAPRARSRTRREHHARGRRRHARAPPRRHRPRRGHARTPPRRGPRRRRRVAHHANIGTTTEGTRVRRPPARRRGGDLA